MQPLEGAVDGTILSESGDAAVVLGEGMFLWRHGAASASTEDAVGAESYSTETRKRPEAGAVGPAALRSRAARMPGMALAGRLPRPISTSVPTMLRTM